MQPHPEQSDDAPDTSTRGLLVGGLVLTVIVIIVLFHLLGVIHG